MRKLILILYILPFIVFKNDVFGQSAFVNQEPVDNTSTARDYQNNIEVYTSALRNKSQTKTDISRLHLLIGINENALGKYKQAIADYSATIFLTPKSAEAYSYRAEDHKIVHKYQLAIKDYKKQLQLIRNDSSGSAVVYNNIAISQRLAGQYNKAIESSSKAIELGGVYGAAYANRAELYEIIGQSELAISDFSVALNGYQGNNTVLSVLFSERADNHKALKQYIDAINDYSYAIELNKNNKIAYWNRAATYDLNGDYQLANDDYSKAIIFYKDDKPSLARLYNDRAQMEIRLHQSKRAIDDEAVSISINNRFTKAYLGKAEAYAQNGDHQLSINYYSYAIHHFKNDKHTLSIIYNGIAGEEYLLNDYKKVIIASTSAIKMDPKVLGAYLNRGKAYLKQLNKDLSMKDFNRVLRMDTSKKSYEYAFALFYTGHQDKAITVLQNNLISTTDSSILINCYYDMACLFSLMDKPEEANIFLKKCIEAGYPRRYLMADVDLNNLYRTKEFKDNIHDNNSL